MRNFFPRLTKAGAAPGTLEHIGKQHLDEIKITLTDYDSDHADDHQIEDINEISPFLDRTSTTWIQVYGLHDIQKLNHVWDLFNLHPLIREDILNTSQRPKVEFYGDCIFFVARMLSYSDQEQIVETEQMSIILGTNYVLCFQETDAQLLEPVAKRLQNDEARIRKQKADYLTYTIIDTLVDHYFNVNRQLAEQIETLEDMLLDDHDESLQQDIHHLRREIIFIRRSIWPLREAIHNSLRTNDTLFKDTTKVYLRDVYDHITQLSDTVDHQRDLMLSMHDMFMSQISNKMNEVMKVLTIIATIFIPLTFIAGIYGMNFNPASSPYNMPELNWYWGYPMSLGIMVSIAIIMIFYFKRKGWF